MKIKYANQEFKIIPINDNDKYYISRYGSVYSTYTNKILKPKQDKDGYLSVVLVVNSKRLNMRVHRLVAMTYIDNPDRLPIINHIDGDKQNNQIENLEWCTYSHNNHHRFLINDIKSGKQIDCLVLSLNTGNVRVCSMAKLSKIVSAEYLKSIKAQKQDYVYTYLERNKDSSITAYLNGQIIHVFKNTTEAAEYYNKKLNTISSKINNKNKRFAEYFSRFYNVQFK